MNISQKLFGEGDFDIDGEFGDKVYVLVSATLKISPRNDEVVSNDECCW